MTEPGRISPAPPGWWVRTNRIGTNASSYDYTVTAVGTRSRTGAAAGTYGWTGTAVGLAPGVQFLAANAATNTSVTIPTHAVGDLIIIAAYNNFSITSPTKPTASGTVPNFTYIDNPAGADNNNITTAQFVATATDHTSGTWNNATHMIAAVLRGQFSTPIGGHATGGATSNNQSTAPTITLTRSDGSSLILHFHGHCNVLTWSAAPAGYTQRALVDPDGGLVLNTKNSSTTVAAIAQPLTGDGSTEGYRGATVEVRYH